MKKLVVLICVLCVCFIPFANADQNVFLKNIVVDQRENAPIFCFASLVEEAYPKVNPEILNDVFTQEDKYCEAWIQISFSTPSEVPVDYRVCFPLFSHEVLLLSENLVNSGCAEHNGIVTDSIRIAVRKNTPIERIISTLQEINPYIEVLNAKGDVVNVLPVTLTEYDENFSKNTSQGFKIYISYGHIRTLHPRFDLSFLPAEVYNDYQQNSDTYCFIDLLGAKSKHTDNPVLGVEFKVINRDNIWAIPTNERIYFSSGEKLSANCDNLLWSGPEFISITLLYKKPQEVIYSYQIYDDIKDLQITAFFSPVGYGSLEEIQGDTIYGPKIGTLVDLSHFHSWMFE